MRLYAIFWRILDARHQSAKWTRNLKKFREGWEKGVAPPHLYG